MDNFLLGLSSYSHVIIIKRTKRWLGCETDQEHYLNLATTVTYYLSDIDNLQENSLILTNICFPFVLVS